MSRPPRLVLPGVPMHITHRGVDRGHTFLGDDDHAFYRWALGEALADGECVVHAYALMTNHVHLLVTPRTASSAARMMMSLGRRYVRYFNDRYRRTGTLWEGRFRSAVVDSASYYLTCSRYIELNPVRAGAVQDPQAYAWSSARRNAGGREDTIVTEHPVFTSLGQTLASRCDGYAELLAHGLPASALATMRADTRGRPRLHRSPYREIVDSL